MPSRHLISLEAGDRGVRAQLLLADAREPLHQHEVALEQGRVPSRPDEVLISPSLAERLGAGVGSTIHPAEGPALAVTGLAEAPMCLSCEQIVATPGSTAARLADPEHAINLPGPDPTYLVDLPAGVSAEALWPALRDSGVALTPREAYLHPERYEGDTSATLDNVQSIAMAMLISGLGLLEVVLLAGAAFAVGARRQTRELGLVGASGGSARHVRRIVLAQGLVLGAFGAVLGVALGFLVAVAGQPLWEQLEDGRIVGWQFGPYEIAGAALIGVLSGVAAAVIPAVGAGRMRPVDALAERFRTSRAARRRTAIVGIVLIAAGALLALAGDRLLADDFAAYARQLETCGRARRLRLRADARWTGGRDHGRRAAARRRRRRARSGGHRGTGLPRRADAALAPARDARRRPPPAPHRTGDERDRRRRRGLRRAGVPARRQPAGGGAAARSRAAAARAVRRRRRHRRARDAERGPTGGGGAPGAPRRISCASR